MDRARIKRVQACFKSFEPCGGAFIARVLLRLSDRHPGIRAFFPENDPHGNKQLFATLRQIIRNLDRFEQIRSPLTALGARAAAERVNPAHYHIIRTELLSTIRELNREQWDAQSESDWESVLTRICETMMAGDRALANAA